MGQLAKEVFNPSCCDGGSGPNQNSARPCGCDPGENHLCEQHSFRIEEAQNTTIIPNTEMILPTATNPKFHTLLKQMAVMHDKKSHDYANKGNFYSNFEEAAAFAGCSVDTVFKVLIGVKLARLNELQSSGKTPNNESIQDSQLDLAVYSALWASYNLV